MTPTIKAQPWLKWLRTCAKDPHSPIKIPRGGIGMLTGQDKRALAAIAACWELYASSDDEGRTGALEAVRALIPSLQPKCQLFARELIPWAMDWSDRERLWPLVYGRVVRLQLSPPIIERPEADELDAAMMALSGNCACDEGRPWDCAEHDVDRSQVMELMSKSVRLHLQASDVQLVARAGLEHAERFAGYLNISGAGRRFTSEEFAAFALSCAKRCLSGSAS